MEKLGGRCLPHTTGRGREKYDKGWSRGGVLMVAAKIDLKKVPLYTKGLFRSARTSFTLFGCSRLSRASHVR